MKKNKIQSNQSGGQADLTKSIEKMGFIGVLAAITGAGFFACATPNGSSNPGGGSQPSYRAYRQAAAGPVIINPRAATPVLVTNADLDAAKSPNVLVEVKAAAPNDEIQNVKLRLVLDRSSLKNASSSEEAFLRPIDVSMTHVAGTTWGASLDSEQLKKLAINGEDLTYFGRVIAKSDKGGVSVSDDAVKLEVKAPIAVEKTG